MHFGDFRLLFWKDTRIYLRKKATLIGVFGKSGCLFTETQIISPKKGNRKSGYREKGLLFLFQCAEEMWHPRLKGAYAGLERSEKTSLRGKTREKH